MKKVLLIVLCLVFVIALVGCDKETIVGSWVDEESDLRIRFKDDDTCEFFGQTAGYRVEDDLLIMIVDGEEQIMEYVLHGDELELIFDVEEDFSLHLRRISVE